jgi:hypothetical protein
MSSRPPVCLNANDVANQFDLDGLCYLTVKRRDRVLEHWCAGCSDDHVANLNRLSLSNLSATANAADSFLWSDAKIFTQSTPLAFSGAFCVLFLFIQTSSDGGLSLTLQTDVAVKPSRPDVPSDVMTLTDAPSLAMPSRNICIDTSGEAVMEPLRKRLQLQKARTPSFDLPQWLRRIS